MLQKTINCRDTEEIKTFSEEIRRDQSYINASDRLLIVWYELWEMDKVKVFAEKLSGYFPDTLITATCFHHRDNILQTPLQAPPEDNFLLSLLLFDNSKVSLFFPSGKDYNEITAGKELNSFLSDHTDIKGVFLNINLYFFSMDDLLKEAKKGFEEVSFFGIKTTLTPEYTNFYISPGKEPVYNIFSAVLFCGKDLHIKTHYNFGWTPMGKEMKITGLSSPTVASRIDDLPASSVYEKYLGLRQEQINPWNTCEFPMVQKKNGVLTARVGMSGREKGSLYFGSTIHVGDVIRLSYGNPDEIYKKVRKDSKKLAAFAPQAEFLIICVNRLMLLKENEHIETDYYTDCFREGAHIYGFAEILSNKKGGGELNSALVSVAMREGDIPESYTAYNEREKKEPDDVSYWDIVPLEYKLFNFFTAMSGDLVDAANHAEKANRAKSEFLSSVSHEIRTPINAILGMDEMILRESTEPAVRRYAENISDSGKLLLGLINDLLDTARIESGKMEIIPVNYDLSSTLNDTINIISPKTAEKGLEFSVNVNPEIPHALNGDETRIKQCAINILNNALKYTLSGSIKLEVDYEKHSESEIMLIISVSDTGTGIKPEDIKKLDRPFERLDVKNNYKVEGSGLGLSIVKRFLDLMGSRLEVESEYGKGSVFSFRLIQSVTDWEPLGDYDTARQKLSQQKSEYRESFRAPDARILVTDDTEMNLIVISSLLKDTKIKIDTASSGMEALELAEGQKYDIIFIDQQMPQMKGSKVLKNLREGKGINADTVCIILTADAVSGAKEKYISQGFNDYISKPVNGPAMEKLIMKYLPEEKILPPGNEGRRSPDPARQSLRSCIDAFKEIEETDYDKALENAGSEATLIEIVNSFIRTGKDTLKVLRESLASSDAENFTVRVHALKSSARTIGADTLSKKAAGLEQLGIKGDLETIRSSFDDFIAEYESLLKKLEKCREKSSETEDRDLPAISNEDLSDYLHRITLLIEDFDYDEAGMIAETLLSYDLKERRDSILKLKDLLNDFDGPAASQLIKDLK